jgi:hypothetical protein
VRDRLSAAERGDAPHRQDTSDLPPPAYEEVVVTAARDADRAERERTNSTARDQSADSRWSRFSNYDDMTPISPNAARMGQK